MGELLKDRFFQPPFLEALSRALRGAYPSFDGARFLSLVHVPAFRHLALKARMRHVAEALGATLPGDYRKALAILLKVEGRFDGFDHLLFADFVERFGVDDYEASIPALERLTRTTAEFAIRPFLRRYLEPTMAQLERWTASPAEHVRRLASEGCRPHLPWGTAVPALIEDPKPILRVLERLKDDPSETVRRSVANNLNDIARRHPRLTLETAERWLRERPSRAAVVRHALRGLLKKGDPRALALFGVGGQARIRIERLAVEPRRVPLGQTARLSIVLVSTSRTPQDLRLEYEMGYARPSGRLGRKVFQIRQTRLAGGARLALERRLDFADRSIRRHHPGRHTLTLVVNGARLQSLPFDLVAPGRRTAARPARAGRSSSK